MSTQNIFDLVDTWNAGGTTFTAIKMNVTDTASASGSLLMDLQVGGASLFNVTKAGRVRAYNTFTDASNYERGKIEWASNVLRIGTEKAGTGSARALELQTDGTTRLTIASTGAVSLSDGTFTTPSNGTWSQPSAIELVAGGNLRWAGRSRIYSSVDGVFTFYNAAVSDFNRLQFGGATDAFPALKRSTTALQVRLADDSAFTNIQGKLTTETAYTAGAPTATGYLVLYDSAGVAYKVPAEAL